MSEESLLSELCNICHTNTPKYRCPRCAVRTCSLPCTRRHKNWSQCSGVRDPAAYQTRTQLLTEPSFDRDFNFITGIERGLERAERVALNRGIELKHEYMVVDKTNSQKHKGKDSRKRKRGNGGNGGNGDDHNAASSAPRLAKGELGFMRAAEASGVRLVRAPRGLSRNKVNHSRVHPKHKCLNWSVEWIVPSTGQSIIRPCLETTPLKDAYDRSFPAPKKSNPPKGQRIEDELSAGENSNNRIEIDDDDASDSHRGVYLYLQRHLAATHRTVLAPLSPAARLCDVLRGRSVVEFPTIYVLGWRLGKEEVEVEVEGEADGVLSAEGGRGRYLLEETYLKDHPDEVEAEMDVGDDSEGSPDASASASGEEEEDDYTSSEGSSSDETSDEDEGEDGTDTDEANGNGSQGAVIESSIETEKEEAVNE